MWYEVPPQTVATKMEAMNCISLCSFTSLKLSSPNPCQHDNAPVPKDSSMKTWGAKAGVGELEWPEQSGLNIYICIYSMYWKTCL